ncbi:unnamed protein product [Polarella glacialis]|uniref:Pentatricopeptide repeat-containing protein-mitochondrial domain-containing protein n=1 Tax=Polarella glacialis TaxID=89957 RepID=A0A813IWD0_POLGL|nr:unnamed protein product [Polarella glacialis]
MAASSPRRARRPSLAAASLVLFVLVSVGQGGWPVDRVFASTSHRSRDSGKPTQTFGKRKSKKDVVDFSSISSSAWREIDARALAGDVKEVEVLFKGMHDKVPTNMKRMLFNTVIKACANAGDVQGAETWRNQMLAAGIEPNLEHYNKIIEAAAKSGDVASAEKWLEAQRRSGIPVDILNYNTVIDACAKAGDLQSAQKWFAEALEVGLIPNLITYSAVIAACAKAGDLQSAQKWFAKALEVGLIPGLITYNNMITACAKAGDLQSAQKWFAQVVEVGLIPDMITYSAAIDACVRAGDCRMAEQLFAKFGDIGMKPDIVMFNTLMSACAWRGDLIGAYEWLGKAIAAKLTPTIFSYIAVIKACGKTKSPQGHVAEHLFRRMISEGIMPNKALLSALKNAIGAPALDRLCGDLRIPSCVLSANSAEAAITMEGGKVKTRFQKEETPAAKAANDKAKLAAQAVEEILTGIAENDAQKTVVFVPATWHTKYKDALGAYKNFVKSQSEQLTIVDKGDNVYVIMKAGDKREPPAGKRDVSRKTSQTEKEVASDTQLQKLEGSGSPKVEPAGSPKLAPKASPKSKLKALPPKEETPAAKAAKAKAKLAAQAVEEILTGIAETDAQKTVVFVPATWGTKYKDALGAYKNFVKSQSEQLTIVDKGDNVYVIMKAGDKSEPPAGKRDVSRKTSQTEKEVASDTQLQKLEGSGSPKAEPAGWSKLAPKAAPKSKPKASPPKEETPAAKAAKAKAKLAA